jgi:AraC-like DNA-binding protein
MNSLKYLTINKPNIPVVDEKLSGNLTCGTFLPPPGSGEVDLEFCPGSVRVRDMYHANFSLREYKGNYDKQALLINEQGVALDHIGVCLFLKGEVQTFLKDCEEAICSFSYSQNYKYDPGNDCRHLIPANRPFHIAHFSVKTDFFEQLLPQEESWADKLRTNVNKRECMIGKRFSPIMKAQVNALQNIYDCPLTGKLGHIMMETSLVQIILLQMHALFNCDNTIIAKQNQRDIDLIYAVKDYITKHFLNDLSIANLTREFGTNRNKIMGLFKRQFGQSIFDYLSDQRMAYAKQMLHQDSTNVSEVARLLSYKNANHFSTAFKKKYGISPTQLKR